MLSLFDMQTQMPDDPLQLNRLYDETIDHHKAYLKKLHDAFNRRCEKIRLDAHKKIETLPKDDQGGRKRALAEEKAELDKVLWELKQAIAKSSNDARKKLEEIEAMMEGGVNLEKELANV